MKTLMISPADVRQPHGHDGRKVDEMVAQLHAIGWVGGPIVALPAGSTYQAVTGASRLEAACRAHLPRIPVAVLDDDEALTCRHSPGWDRMHDIPEDTSALESTLMAAGMDDVAQLIKTDEEKGGH